MRRQKGYITRQAQRLSEGEINRRRFVMSALSAGVTMPTALSLASKAQAKTPKPGGQLRVATGSEDSFTRLVSLARGNCLTEIEPTGEVIGELAAEFTNQNHRIWTFHLRPGVTFQDGEALSAATVATRLTEAGLALVEDIRVGGPDTFRIELTRPDPHFPRLLADPRFVILKEDRTGTGPYRIELLETGKARLVRRADYWKPGRAHVDAVELTLMPDLNARVHALMAGDVDYADQIDPRAMALLQRAPNVRVVETRGTRHIALTARDPKLLQRVAAHIPRNALVEQLLLGHGTAAPAFDGPSPNLAMTGSLRFAVHDTGVPRVMEAARLIAERLDEAGAQVAFVSPSEADEDTIHIAWQSSVAEAPTNHHSLVALWANDLAAHQSSLGHDDQVGAAMENDDARLIERWWIT